MTIRVLNKRIETIIKKKSSNIFVVHIFSARALHPLLLLVLEKKFLIKLSYFIINMFIYLTINIMLCRQEPHIELANDLILIQYLSCSMCIFCFVKGRSQKTVLLICPIVWDKLPNKTGFFGTFVMNDSH